MQLSTHDSQVLETFQREYRHFDRYRTQIASLQDGIAAAEKKTGLSGVWARTVTIPRLKKKRDTARDDIATRRERLKFATEGALFTLGSKSIKQSAVVIPSKSAMQAYALTRYFHVMSELAEIADRKISAAVGRGAGRSPMDYYSGYEGRSGLNRKSIAEDYHALMEAGDYTRMFQTHIKDANEDVHKVFAQVTAARSVHNALADIYRYPGSVDSMLLSRRPEKAREDLVALRDSIRRLHDSFIREITNAQALYPAQSGKMNAAFLNSLAANAGDLPEGEDTLAKMRDAMDETGLKATQRLVKKTAVPRTRFG